MARTAQVIQNQITAFYVAAMAAIGITIDPTKWSRRNKQQLALNTFATGTATFEQIYDTYTTNIETIIAQAAPQTDPWWQNFCLNIFQYNATVPQILQYNTTTFYWYYPTVNADYLLVTQCIVVPGIAGTTRIKVAKTVSGAYVALASGELAALQSTLRYLCVDGIAINATTANSDKIYINGTLTYQGAYSGVIPVSGGTAVLALQNYLASIPASGVLGYGSTAGLMKLTDLIAAVRAVPGVIDFQLNFVNARIDGATLVPTACNLVNGGTWLIPEYQSGLLGAGYMTLDTTGPVGADGLTNINYIAS